MYAAVVATMTLSFVGIPSGAAQEVGLVEIPVGTVVRSDPGVTTLLGVATVPEELVGTSCGVRTRAENNESVHPGNDLVVASGGGSVTLVDVEGSSGKITVASSPLTLGTEVTITLIMGRDGVFSGGASSFVVVDCTPPTSTTTTTTSTTTTSSTTTSTTTVPASTTIPPTTTIDGPTTSVVGPTSTTSTSTTTTIDEPASTSTTSPPTSTTTLPTESPTLAFTGPSQTLALAIAGIVLLDLGYLIFSVRQPAPVRGRSD